MATVAPVLPPRTTLPHPLQPLSSSQPPRRPRLRRVAPASVHHEQAYNDPSAMASASASASVSPAATSASASASTADSASASASASALRSATAGDAPPARSAPTLPSMTSVSPQASYDYPELSPAHLVVRVPPCLDALVASVNRSTLRAAKPKRTPSSLSSSSEESLVTASSNASIRTPSREVSPARNVARRSAANQSTSTASQAVQAPIPPPSYFASQALATSGLPRIRHALTLIRHPLVVNRLKRLAARSDSAPDLVAIINEPSSIEMTEPSDIASVVVAAHTLCNHQTFRTNFLTAGGLSALCNLVRPALQVVSDNVSLDRVVTSAGVFAEAEKLAAAHRVAPSTDSESTLTSSAQPPVTKRLSGTSHVVGGGIHRVLWNAAIRTIAKLMVCSTAACVLSIDSGSLALLAKAAKPSEPMDIRLRAAAGLAAIAAWSGPRRAVEIVQTDEVVQSMTAILTERDERIPGDLRTATIDGLVVMSFRRHARGILQKFGCDEKIKFAARNATVSGDYTAAARSTVAAGQLTGRSIDEYGFLVQEETPEDKSSPDALDSAENHRGEGSLRTRPTGLQHIQQQLLEEPYASVEDLGVLEEIVNEDTGLLSSSPRDRNYIRRTTRAFGISADELEFISLLEEEASPQKHEDGVKGPSPGHPPVKNFGDSVQPTRQKTGAQRSFSSDASDIANQILPSNAEVFEDKLSAGQSSSRVFRTASGRNSGSSPQVSSNLLPTIDPDFDRLLRPEDEEETTSTATGPSSKSKIVSPLLMFSSATKKAAEKDAKNHQLQKTTSQLSRETEHERFWKEVLEKKTDMLKRERGRSSRVVAYRELALVPVPPAMRRKLWPILLDVGSLRQARPGLYRELCKQGEGQTLPDDIEHTIDADVTRTMPLHSLFWAGGAQVGVTSLRSILRAYARYVPEVGYCQGMSSIVAVLLMNAEDEEEAFLMMVQFMSRFQYKKVFARGFPLMLQWIAELKPLVAHYMPELSAHLERENVVLEVYADKWLITALSHNFPHRHLLRVWDLMFLGGSPKIVLKACLTVLKHCESQLLALDFERIMPFLQRGFSEPEAGVLDAKDPEPFINEMREYRFLPDIPKSQLASGDGNAATGANSKTSNPSTVQNNEKKSRRGGCFPCFKKSATLD